MNRHLFGFAVAFAVLLAAVGCGDKKGAKDTKQGANTAKKDDHDHHHAEGPHGGHIIELGGSFHAELVHDDDAATVTVYLLDEDMKKPVFSDDKEITLSLTVNGQPQQFKLPAAKQEGDSEGLFSRYEVKDAKVIEALEAPKTQGKLHVSIGGTKYDAELEHEHHH
jgi:hypothetical protein